MTRLVAAKLAALLTKCLYTTYNMYKPLLPTLLQVECGATEALNCTGVLI